MSEVLVRTRPGQYEWVLSAGEDVPFAPGLGPGSAPDPKETPGDGYILVVEDNSGDAELLRWSLRDHGLDRDLVVLTDGEKAIRFFSEIDEGGAPCPALVVLDLNLPKRTGLEVLQSIRERGTCRETPVVVFSSSTAPQDVQESRRLGANLYIRKPSNLDEFLQVGGRLKALLEGAGQQ